MISEFISFKQKQKEEGTGIGERKNAEINKRDRDQRQTEKEGKKERRKEGGGTEKRVKACEPLAMKKAGPMRLRLRTVFQWCNGLDNTDYYSC